MLAPFDCIIDNVVCDGVEVCAYALSSKVPVAQPGGGPGQGPGKSTFVLHSRVTSSLCFVQSLRSSKASGMRATSDSRHSAQRDEVKDAQHTADCSKFRSGS